METKIKTKQYYITIFGINGMQFHQ